MELRGRASATLTSMEEEMVSGIEISVVDQEPRVDSRLIATRLGIGHRPMYRLLVKYQTEMSELGKVCFENAPSAAGQNQKFAHLNEDQSIFALTLTKNTVETVALKLDLTKAFKRFRDMALRQARAAERRAHLDWQQSRQDGKLDRRAQTDTIKEFTMYAQAQGSKNAHRYYQNITSMENKALFILASAFPRPDNIRDILDTFQLGHIRTADNIIIKALREGMDQGMHYKDIFQMAKQRIIQFSDLIGRTQILPLACSQPAQAALL